MSIWKVDTDLQRINARHANTIVELLDIRVTEIGEDFITASMPVDHKTHQPRGILHGGASVLLAESIGSLAANMALTPGFFAVGLDINANHIKSVKAGLVFATATPIHIGRSTHVWHIQIKDQSDRLICIARLTMAVLPGESK